ncbi:putative HLH transcription factor [Lentinula raphanica]|nr:putative HLH transcription factor [Lentinula raphanica]
MQSPLTPPAPYADFQLSFDPQLSNHFPQPPQLPPSAELFSQAETNELFNFLDGFDDSLWDAEHELLDLNSHAILPESPQLLSHSPYLNLHSKTIPKPNPAASSSRARRSTRNRPARAPARSTSKSSSHTSSSTTPPAQPFNEPTSPISDSPTQARAKPLLSTPQKRLNHIMSEQKRRNAIRDGYAQLITLLAPSGSAPALGMPTRGRPKGSGSRGKAGKKAGSEGDGAKGKSGVLFRAVEYCRWLEEGREALLKEVARVEAAAGLTAP